MRTCGREPKGQNEFLDLLDEDKKTKFSFLQSYKPQMKNSSRTQLPERKIKRTFREQSNLRTIIIPFLFTQVLPLLNLYNIILEKLKKARNFYSKQYC